MRACVCLSVCCVDRKEPVQNLVQGTRARRTLFPSSQHQFSAYLIYLPGASYVRPYVRPSGRPPAPPRGQYTTYILYTKKPPSPSLMLRRSFLARCKTRLTSILIMKGLGTYRVWVCVRETQVPVQGVHQEGRDPLPGRKPVGQRKLLCFWRADKVLRGGASSSIAPCQVGGCMHGRSKPGVRGGWAG